MCEACNSRRSISLGFTEEHVLEGQHLCYIYRDDAERRRTMARYVASGLLESEKVLFMADTVSPDEMLGEMRDLDIDIDQYQDRLTLGPATGSYLPTGAFECHTMLSYVEQYYRQAVEDEGCAGARGMGEMNWCLDSGSADVMALMEYETRLNSLLTTHPFTACCQYDARLFDGGTIMDVLAVHPVAIVRGQLVRNPFYVPPETFLHELAHRRHTEL